jgi:hypothetical protein
MNNSDLPNIKVTKKPFTKKTIDDINKLSGIMLQKMKNTEGGRKKKKKKINKTRKLKSKYY